MSRVLVLLTVVPFVAFASPAPVPRPPAAVSVEQRVFRSWVEATVAERDADGFVVEKAGEAIEDRCEYDFTPEGLDWCRVPGPRHVQHWYDEVRIDAGRTPMRMDLIWRETSTMKGGVRPAVFKFDGEKLVMAFPYDPKSWVVERAGGEYAERPKDFAPRAGVEVSVLVRCRYLQQAGGK